MNDAVAMRVLSERRDEHRKAVEKLKPYPPSQHVVYDGHDLAWHRRQIAALTAAINRLAGKP